MRKTIIELSERLFSSPEVQTKITSTFKEIIVIKAKSNELEVKDKKSSFKGH